MKNSRWGVLKCFFGFHDSLDRQWRVPRCSRCGYFHNEKREYQYGNVVMGDMAGGDIVKSGLDDMDATLTPEERAAPTFTEWSDDTLARGVRALAAKLHDSVGFNGIAGMAAALALVKIARDSNAGEYNITIDGTKITVRLPKEK